MMLYKNTKVMGHLPNVDTDFFDIVAGVSPGNTFVPYMFIICRDNVLRTPTNLIKES